MLLLQLLTMTYCFCQSKWQIKPLTVTDTTATFGKSEVKKIRQMKERLLYLEGRLPMMERLKTKEIEVKHAQSLLLLNQLNTLKTKKNHTQNKYRKAKILNVVLGTTILILILL